LAKREEIAPIEWRQERTWTRIADYWPDARATLGGVHWGGPVTVGDFRRRPKPNTPPRVSRRGWLLPVAAVLFAILLSIWGSGVLQRKATDRTITSTGLVFGLCSEGGLTNCIASGDSFYLGGKTVRIAGIEAPQLYGAACPKEAALGKTAATKLQSILNSGGLQHAKAGPDLERYDLLLRAVTVNGKDVGKAMVDAGLARDIGDLTRSWC
jgi:endonuclease YncB( thermonuclease family)